MIEVDARLQRRALLAIAGSQLLALTLWFSASAVAPQLSEVWRLSSGETAWLTLSVQVGFVVGALSLAILNVADIVPSRRLFFRSAIIGLSANAALVLLGPGDFTWAVLFRFTTGAALAGVYPAGLKVMAGWFNRGRGMALGVLVGALTIGSAGPHLIRGMGFDWQGVVLTASGLALVAAVLMAVTVSDGPFEVPAPQFSWRQVGRVVRNRGYRLSTFGYLGHMWELYAMWTWTAAYLAASSTAADRPYVSASLVTFFVIAAGGPGAWWAGVLADRYGRTLVAGSSMAISGSCALLSAAVFGRPAPIVIPVFLIWGFTVVADSAQFSTMATETADAEVRGTSLALQTAVGFLLTLVTIRGVPILVEAWGWRWAFPWLALGPAFGVGAMVRLRNSPARALLAGGKG